MPGWVYVITNDSMPELVKIGFTTRHPRERAKELEGTNVPGSFVVEYAALVEQPRDLEYDVQKHLSSFGLRVDKEWFRCDVGIAIWSIGEVYDGKIAEWYSDEADEARIRAETEIALYRKRLADRDKYEDKLRRENQQQEITQCLDKTRRKLMLESAIVIRDNPRAFPRLGKLNVIRLHITVVVGLCVFWGLYFGLAFGSAGETDRNWQEQMSLSLSFSLVFSAGSYLIATFSGAIISWHRRNLAKIKKRQHGLLLPVRRLFPDVEKEIAYYKERSHLDEPPSFITPFPASLQNAIGGKAYVTGGQFSGTIRNSTQDWVVTLVVVRIPLAYEPCSFRVTTCVLPGQEEDFEFSVDPTAADSEHNEKFSWTIHQTFGYRIA